MIDPKEYSAGKQKLNLKVMVIGGSGVGKTTLASTFPKSYFMVTEPGGEDTWLTVPELKNNVVGFDRFIPTSEEDTKRVFIELDKACINAREMAQKGEIETVVLDNFTYLAENRWIYLNKFEPEISPKTGEIDTRSMYGKLSRYLYNFTLMKLLTIPANLVVNFHEKLESDDVMEKKPNKDTPLVASCLGGFRDDAPGMFSLVLFLDKKKGVDGKYHYMARTNLGNGRQGKSRYPGIPEILENISYKVISDSVNKAIGIKQ